MAERSIEDIMAEIFWREANPYPHSSYEDEGDAARFHYQAVAGRRLAAMDAAGLRVVRGDDGR